MKVRSSVKPICEKCKVIKRKGRQPFPLRFLKISTVVVEGVSVGLHCLFTESSSVWQVFDEELVDQVEKHHPVSLLHGTPPEGCRRLSPSSFFPIPGRIPWKG